MNRILPSVFLFVFGSFGLHAVPAILNYAGQVAVNGQPFDGQGLFKFALVNADGNATYWSNDGTSANGSEPAVHVGIAVNGGLYSLLLGNTAMSGMGAIDPQVFAQHGDAKLRVWFSDGVNGFQQLSPDRPFASVPYAFSAETATIADGSINKSMLGSDVISDLNKTVTITRDMLPQDVRDDLNATIGMNRLSAEVITKLDQNGSGGTGVVAGSLISVPYGQSAPAGYSLYQRGEPKELVWEEKAPVSIARYAYDGVEVLGGKIYFIGGYNGAGSKNIAERYDPATNTWESLNSLSVARHGVASAVLNGKFYAIGGKNGSNNLSSVEMYDPISNTWSAGVSLPSEVNHGTAITVDGKIYLIGGKNASDQKIDQVLCFDPSTNQWSTKANMPTARESMELIWFEDRIWAIGGKDGNQLKSVESYDPNSDSWKTETDLSTNRFHQVSWVANGRIYAGGGYNGTSYLDSIEVYDPATKQWSNLENFPENKYVADAVILNDKVYVIAGATASSVYSDKVFAADLNASVEGVYDLYRKDGNASAGSSIVQAEVADGSVTTAKLDATILKYLKPEITAHPQTQNVYAHSSASFSVTAEGKYLSYQWKKDGVDLTAETNATLNITNANATLHDGNYSVVVSNDFGSVESVEVDLVLSLSPFPSSGLKLWLDANDTNSIIHQSNKISVWNDKSGNSNNATQSLSDKQPEFANGQVSFDGLNDILELPSMGLSVDAMVIFVYTPLNDSGYSVVGSSSGNDHWDRYSSNGHTYANHFTQTRMTGVGLNFPNTGEQIVTYMADSSSSNYKIRFNGTTVREFSQSFAFADNVKQIGGALATGSEFNGKLDELIITDEFSLVIIQHIEGYLAHKWGLTANLPSEHPYKNNAP